MIKSIARLGNRDIQIAISSIGGEQYISLHCGDN